MIALVAFCLSYTIGSFPTGKLVAWMYGVRIEQVGSGNVGATNIARTLGKKPGIVTLLADMGKGITALIMARSLAVPVELEPLIGLTVVAGHCFSIPGKLRGGKGVATAFGCLIALEPLLSLIVLSIFTLLFLLKRIVSLASIGASLTVIAAGFTGASIYEHIGYIGLGVLVIARHTANIRRLLAGTEAPFSFSKSTETASINNSP
jgi:acyl phosphate:glycerol-3-phosphate acyltransferase